LAMSARRVAVMLGNAIPEETRGKAVARIAGINVTSERAHDLRHLRVAMKTSEPILMTLERVHHRVMFELASKHNPSNISRVSVKIRQHFGHATEFGVQHPLQLCLVELGKNVLCPRGKLDFELESNTIARVTIRVAQSGIILVQHIPW